jgi:hypothetical protein
VCSVTQISGLRSAESSGGREWRSVLRGSTTAGGQLSSRAQCSAPTDFRVSVALVLALDE